MRAIGPQALVLATADTYRALGVLAILLIPLVLRLTYIPAPDLRAAPQASSSQRWDHHDASKAR
jgi:DHA2 family multidrug resistance protein